jgi:hypothetical protein
MAHAAQQIGLREYLHSITESGARIARLEQATPGPPCATPSLSQYLHRITFVVI